MESNLKQFWQYLHTLDWFVRFESQAKQVCARLWAKLREYWGQLGDQVKMAQQRIGPEIPSKIASFCSSTASKMCMQGERVACRECDSGAVPGAAE